MVAGDFTFMERLRSAIKENLLFYLAGTIVFGVLLIIIAVTKGIHGLYTFFLFLLTHIVEN